MNLRLRVTIFAFIFSLLPVSVFAQVASPFSQPGPLDPVVDGDCDSGDPINDSDCYVVVPDEFIELSDTPSAFTNGSILFTSGTAVTEDNTNFFWDDTNNRLGVGTATPTATLNVAGVALSSDDVLVVTGATAAAGAAGGGISLTSGAAGVSTGVAGGVGGALTLTSGVGGSSDVVGGNGGVLTFTAGAGGAGTGFAAAFGGDGGSLSFVSGDGAAGAAFGGLPGDAGGISFVSGDGGSSGGVGGQGGNISLTAGSSITTAGVINVVSGSASGTNQKGGDVNITSGDGGAGGTAAGGDVVIQASTNPKTGELHLNALGGNVGVGTSSPLQIFHVEADVSGGVLATFVDDNGGVPAACDVSPAGAGVVCASDETLKRNIEPLEDSLENILKLKTVNYLWVNEGDEGVENKIGFLAQDVQKYYPELVSENSLGKLGVGYARFTPILVDAVRELSDQLNDKKPLGKKSANSQITSFLSNTRDKVINGFVEIKSLWASVIQADVVDTKEICVDGICIEKDQFKKLLEMNDIEYTVLEDTIGDYEAEVSATNGTSETFETISEVEVESGVDSESEDADILQNDGVFNEDENKDIGEVAEIFETENTEDVLIEEEGGTEEVSITETSEETIKETIEESENQDSVKEAVLIEESFEDEEQQEEVLEEITPEEETESEENIEEENNQEEDEVQVLDIPEIIIDGSSW